MKSRVLIVVAAIVVAVVIVGFVVVRLIVADADNVDADPATMVTSYRDASGVTFYGFNAGINNAYLIPCDGGWLLVDTGYPGDYERFKSALATTGLNVSAIRALFITHAHDEHAGFAAALVAEAGCGLIVPKLALSDLEAGQMVWNGKSINGRIAVASALYNAVKKRDMRFPPVVLGADDVALEGDIDASVVCPGVHGRFIATPGHSPDSYSLVLDDGRAFVGDAAMNYLNGLGADYRPIFVTDEQETYASLERVLRLGASTLYTGHGPAFGADEARRVIDRYAK